MEEIRQENCQLHDDAMGELQALIAQNNNRREDEANAV
ncbi:hypothetical protein A2U01_0068236, partial [Trifolium medium]|nr:hypothetical protein [Trifolium medium]